MSKGRLKTVTIFFSVFRRPSYRPRHASAWDSAAPRFTGSVKLFCLRFAALNESTEI